MVAAVVGDGVVDGGEGSEEAGQVAEQNRVCRVLGKYAQLEEALSILTLVHLNLILAHLRHRTTLSSLSCSASSSRLLATHLEQKLSWR